MSRAGIVSATHRIRCTECGEVLEPTEYGTQRVTVGNRDNGPVCSRNACQVAATRRLEAHVAELAKVREATT